MPPGETAMKTAMSEETARDIGEIKGLLHGVTQMIQTNNEAMNRRIDDMHNSNSRRLDDLNRTLSGRLESQETRITSIERKANDAHTLATTTKDAVDAMRGEAKRTGIVSGTSAGVLVTAMIEFIKVAFKSS